MTITYEDVIRKYRHYKGTNKTIKDPETGRKVWLYNSYPGGLLVHYKDGNDESWIYVIRINSDGTYVSGHDKAVLWNTIEGTRLIRRFNDYLNTSLYGWYNLREIIDYDTIKFNHEVSSYDIANTSGRVTARSILQGNAIFVEISLDGEPVDLKKEKLHKSPVLNAGIRTVMREITSRTWTSIVLEYVRKHDLLTQSERDNALEIDMNELDELDYEYIAKTAAGIVISEGLTDLEVQDTGKSLVLTRSNNPIFKMTFDYDNGEMLFLNRRGVVERLDDVGEVAYSIWTVSKKSDQLLDQASYWSRQIESLVVISKGLDSINKSSSAIDVLDIASDVLNSITNGRIKLSKDKPLYTSIVSFYNDTRSHLTYLLDSLDLDKELAIAKSRSHLALLRTSNELLNSLRIRYEDALRGYKVGGNSDA